MQHTILGLLTILTPEGPQCRVYNRWKPARCKERGWSSTEAYDQDSAQKHTSKDETSHLSEDSIPFATPRTLATRLVQTIREASC